MNHVKVVQSTAQSVWKNISYSDSQAAPNLIITDELKRNFEGYGSCANELGIAALMNLSPQQQSQIYDDLFSPEGACRFTYCRLPIGANDYSFNWYSYNENDGDYAMEKFSIERDREYIIPYIKQALKRNPNLIFCASPWSPPAWMKQPQVYNSGALRWDEATLQAYALYFVKYVQAYQAEGINIHQIHVQNEVVSNHIFPSCKWTGEQLRDFIKHYLGPAFEKHAIKSEIWLATINAPHPRIEWKEKRTEDFDVYAGLVLEDPDAYKYIKGVGYQWAGRDVIQKNVESYPELQYLQTECECGDSENTWFYAQYLFTLFRHYIINGANGFLYWNAILEKQGKSSWGTQQNSMIGIDSANKKIAYNYEFWLVKHFSHYVQKGAHRIHTEGPHTANTLAFKNPDNSIVIIVANRKNEPRELVCSVAGRSISVVMDSHSFITVVLS